MTDEASPARRGFEVLSDETRLTTLRVLAERLREAPESPALGFAELRRRVGRRDSGNFNYHLDRLRGRFVVETDEGYRIAPAGLKVVAGLVAGTYGAGAERGPTALEDPCPVCGESLAFAYERGLVSVRCENDHAFENALPPGAVEDRDVEAVLDLLTLRTKQAMETARAGACPFCYAPFDWSVDPDRERDLPEVAEQCSRCGVRVEMPAVAALFGHPDAVAFYRDHGLDLRERRLWAPEFYDAEVDVSADPVRVRVAVELDGDVLEATLDGDLAVVDVSVR